jgi:glycosyltransferase involved in cell wall biosynthesis
VTRSNSLPVGTSVVVPVYNGGDTLEELLSRLRAALGTASDPYEVIFVDDGSEDHTWAVVSTLASRDGLVRAIRLMRNYGQHNALLAGIRAAAYDVTVTIDADLQYPAERIPELVAKVREGSDVVYGTAGRRSEGLMRRSISRVARRLLRAAMGIDATFSSFRAFRTRLRDGFAGFGGPYVSIDVLLSWSTRRFASIPIVQSARREGRSSYSMSRLASLGLTMMTGFSTRPLRLASLVGFAFTTLGLGLLVYVLVSYLVHGQIVHGFTFLASIISIFAGAQLFALGIIGEYMARVHMRVLDPPTYAIREELGAQR